MKKSLLTWAGIGAAIILAAMFLWILLAGTFTIFPSAVIDPLPDHAAGQTVIISGTTNCMAGTFLDLDIVPVTARAGPARPVRTLSAFISRGPQGANVWSGSLDTSRIPPGSYLVNVYWMNETTRSGLLASSFMRITDAPSGAVSAGARASEAVFIAVNSPLPLLPGDRAEIAGTTNLAPGSGLLWAIAEEPGTAASSGTKNGTVNPGTGFVRSGSTIVQPGAGGINRWSLVADTGALPPGQYRIAVSRPENSTDPAGDCSGTAPLFIRNPGSAIDPDAGIPGLNPAGSCSAITIDVFPDLWIGSKYTISGTSTFPPGTDLMVELRPEEYQLTMDPGTGMPVASLSGAMGRVTTEPGPGNSSFWYLTLDRGSLDPDKRTYRVNVSNNRVDPVTYATIEGGSWCTRRLLLPEGSS